MKDADDSTLVQIGTFLGDMDDNMKDRIDQVRRTNYKSYRTLTF